MSKVLGDQDKFNMPLNWLIKSLSFYGAIILIACSDIVINAEEALFSFTKVLIGLLQATISPYFIRSIGASKVRRIIFNALLFNSEESISLVFISKSIPMSKLDEVIER